MREIKFRCWDRVQNKMHLPDNMGYQILTPAADYFDADVYWMQFTGLLDKNGKEIYEGDMIQDCLTKAKMQVVFGQNKQSAFNGWYCKYIGISVKDVAINGDYDTNQNSNIEVIGNIYETPHLLNNEQNVKVSDTTEGDSSNAAKYKNNKTKKP